MLALIPLDDRPCNLLFPQQIAAIGCDEMTAPPANTLGRFNTPGEPAALSGWLRDLKHVEALIVSIDMLAYGGLVASRTPRVAVETALERLEVLREFRAAHPEVPIYAFNVVMRLAVTLDGDDAVSHYYNVMRYARLCDEAERFESDYLRAELRKVEAEIPPPVLHDYLAARARNHAVNRAMIDWLAEGVFDYLLLTQEDAGEFGLHRREQENLLAHGDECGVRQKMSLHPGADEAALTLLARHWNSGVRFRVHWSNREDAARIAPFEDRPYQDALAQHIAAMQGRLLDENALPPGTLPEEVADFALFVNAPVGGSQNEEDETKRNARGLQLAAFVREMEVVVQSGQPVALCDVAFPNGADNLLMTQLEKRGLLGQLAVFGAWNTAGNTTGTVLAQCAALKKAAGRTHYEQAKILSRQFVFERLVDDWFYQSRVRSGIEKTARSRGVSPLKMSEADAAPLEAQTRRELRGFAQLLAQRHFHTPLASCEIALPWQRTFEAEVRAQLV